MIFGSKGVVGLDIGSSTVKAVQVRRSGGNLELEKFGVADIYPNGDKSATGIDLNSARTDAVRRALAEAGITAKNVNSSVGGEPVIVRYIQMHQMPEAELANALQWEAEGYIPYEIDEVNIDHVTLGPSSDGTNKLDVLLVAVKKDLIDEHMALVQTADLMPSAIDVDSFAFLNQFEFNNEPNSADTIALIDIGAQTTSISIYRDGYSRFSRDISVAGDTITGAIANKLNMPFVQAEQLKLQQGAPIQDASTKAAIEETKKTFAEAGGTAGAGGTGGSDLLERIRGTVERITGEDLGDNSPEAAARKAIKATMTNLVSEIRRSLQFYENQGAGANVSRIVLGGGTSRMKGIDQFFTSQLNLPCSVCDPLGRVSPKGKDIDAAQLADNRALLSVAVGLAIRDLAS